MFLSPVDDVTYFWDGNSTRALNPQEVVSMLESRALKGDCLEVLQQNKQFSSVCDLLDLGALIQHHEPSIAYSMLLPKYKKFFVQLIEDLTYLSLYVCGWTPEFPYPTSFPNKLSLSGYIACKPLSLRIQQNFYYPYFMTAWRIHELVEKLGSSESYQHLFAQCYTVLKEIGQESSLLLPLYTSTIGNTPSTT